MNNYTGRDNQTSNERIKNTQGPAPTKHYPGKAGILDARLWWVAYYLRDFIALIAGSVPSHFFRNFVYKYLLGVKIGKQTSIHSRCRLYNPSGIQIGRNSIINNDILLDGRTGLVIGDNVSISEGTAIFILEHNLDSPDFSASGGPVHIEDYVFIGARSIILPGVTLGRGSAVGAGSIVTRSVEPFAIVAGNPAHFIKFRNKDLRYQFNYRKLFG